MAVELGGISLEKLTEVAVGESARIVRHAVPGMSGDLTQTLGRPSVEVTLRGVFYGTGAAASLEELRQAFLERRPVDFFSDAVGEGYFAQVLISALEVRQRAGFPGQFDFACRVVEYVEPLAPVPADPLAALDAELALEAASFLDQVQDALEQPGGL